MSYPTVDAKLLRRACHSPITFGGAILAYRLLQDLGPEEVARDANLSPGRLLALEDSREAPPELSVVVQLAHALRVCPFWLCALAACDGTKVPDYAGRERTDQAKRLTQWIADSGGPPVREKAATVHVLY